MNKKPLILLFASLAVLLGFLYFYALFNTDFRSYVDNSLLDSVKHFVPLHLYVSNFGSRGMKVMAAIYNLIFYLLLLIGIFQYATNRSGILRMVVLVIFVENTLSLIYFFYWIFQFVSYLKEHPEAEYSMILILGGVLVNVLWALGSFWILRVLGKKDTYAEYSYGEGETKQIVVQEQSNGKRFWNMVIDSGVFTLIFIKYILGIGFELKISDGWQGDLYLYIAFFYLLYDGL